jgi:hypothetical protein
MAHAIEGGSAHVLTGDPDGLKRLGAAVRPTEP